MSKNLRFVIILKVIRKLFSNYFLISFFLAVGFFVLNTVVHAQGLAPDKQTIAKAQVLEVISQEVKNIPGTDTKNTYQTLKVKILDGDEQSKEITIENDYLDLKVGEIFYFTHTTSSFDSRDYYSVFEPYRLPALYLLIGLFILCVLIFGGIQGLRGLVALAGSFFFIFYLLFPAILNGYSPIMVSVGVSALIIIIGSYITHGFNKTTTSAVVGMVITILITGALAYFAVYSTRLSGFSTEEAVYLNFSTHGSIDFVGLLLGSIMIGLLGVLYDAAITQSIAIEELSRIGPHLSRGFIFKRALRMGREHIGALVNTLAIAYVGASLPLLILFYSSTTSGLNITMNREIFATEIVRIMVGSIGLVLAIPITTLISVFVLVRPKVADNEEVLDEEKKAIKTTGHVH